MCGLLVQTATLRVATGQHQEHVFLVTSATLLTMLQIELHLENLVCIYLYSSVLLVARLSSCVLGPAHTSNSHSCTTLEGFSPLSHSALISSKFVDVGQFYSGVSCVWLWADL